MNAIQLKTFSDQELIVRTENLVKQEREILNTVLQHLHEVDRRRLYSALKYKSLFEFAVQHLKYTEDQAYRRIAAMKFVRELPETENKIISGELNLSLIGVAHSHIKKEEKFKNAKLSKEEKLLVFNQISEKSVREAEKITLSMSTAPVEIRPDLIKHVTSDDIEIRFTANKKVQEKIETLKGLLAHKHPNASIGEIFELLCDLGIEHFNPGKSATSRKRKVDQNEISPSLQNLSTEFNHDSLEHTKTDLIPNSQPSILQNTINQTQRKSSEFLQQQKISQAEIYREVYRRAGNACQNCGSKFALEIEHCQPRALGGDSSLENLRLLCKSCNQRAAIHVFGLDKMDSFLN